MTDREAAQRVLARMTDTHPIPVANIDEAVALIHALEAARHAAVAAELQGAVEGEGGYAS